MHFKLLREQCPIFRELTLPKKTWETKLKDKLLARSLKQLYMHKLKQQSTKQLNHITSQMPVFLVQSDNTYFLFKCMFQQRVRGGRGLLIFVINSNNSWGKIRGRNKDKYFLMIPHFWLVKYNLPILYIRTSRKRPLSISIFGGNLQELNGRGPLPRRGPSKIV